MANVDQLPGISGRETIVKGQRILEARLGGGVVKDAPRLCLRGPGLKIASERVKELIGAETAVDLDGRQLPRITPRMGDLTGEPCLRRFRETSVSTTRMNHHAGVNDRPTPKQGPSPDGFRSESVTKFEVHFP